MIRVEGGGSDCQVGEYLFVGGQSFSNRLEIADGGRCIVWSSAYIGQWHWENPWCEGWTSNNVVRIENGELQVHGNFIAITEGGRLEIAGTNSLLYSGTTLAVVDSSVLRFEFGTTMPSRALIQGLWGTTWLHDWRQNWLSLNYRGFVTDGTATLEIDAQKFACAGGGRVVLMETRWDSNADLYQLLENVVWDGRKCGTVDVEYYTLESEDPNNYWLAHMARLVAHIDNQAGTVIMLR